MQQQQFEHFARITNVLKHTHAQRDIYLKDKRLEKREFRTWYFLEFLYSFYLFYYGYGANLETTIKIFIMDHQIEGLEIYFSNWSCISFTWHFIFLNIRVFRLKLHILC